MSTSASYIRIKRHKLTVFLHCDLNDTVRSLKERVEKLTSRPANQMKLLLGKQDLENNTSLADCGIDKEDAELLLVYSTGEETWEDPADAAGGKEKDAPSSPA